MTSQFISVVQVDDFMGLYEFVHEIYKLLDMDTGDFALVIDNQTKKVYFIFDRPHFKLITATLSDDYTEVTGESSTNYNDMKLPFSRKASTLFERGGKIFFRFRNYRILSKSDGCCDV